MKKSTKIILSGAAVLVAAGGIALASQGWQMHKGMRAAVDFVKSADTDKDDALTLLEINTAISGKFTGADTNSDNSVSKAELIAAIEGLDDSRFLRRKSGSFADRFVYRFDLDDNGSVTLDEIQNRTAKFFALVDRNDDGKVVEEEFRRMNGMGHGYMRGHGRHHRWGGWWSDDNSREPRDG